MLDIYKEIANLLASGEPAVLATVLGGSGSTPRKSGAKMLIRRDGSSIGTVGGGVAEQRVCEAAPRIMLSGKSEVLHFKLSGESLNIDAVCGGEMDVLMESIVPPEMLFVVGAGHVGQSVVVMGKTLGFRVVVIDPRADLNSKARLPEADSLVVKGYVAGLKGSSLSANSYVVICTPGHVSDADCLRVAAPSAARYVGMIGSKRKVIEVKERLLARGVAHEKLERVHAPIGLEIGAETPEEIAVSIMAEIDKVRRGLET